MDNGYWILDNGYWIMDTGYWKKVRTCQEKKERSSTSSWRFCITENEYYVLEFFNKANQ
jgi:hypothetical protein